VSFLPARGSGTAALLIVFAVPAARAEEAARLLDEPSSSAQKEAEAALKDLLKAEYASAKKADGALVLAKKLLQYGGEEKSNAAQRYVCFREARDLAAKGGDSRTAIAAIDAIAASFKVDALEMKRTALDAARRAMRSTAAFSAAAREYAPLIDGAVAADRHDLAARLAADFLSAAEKAKLDPLIAEANARKRDVRDIKAEFDRTAAERAAVAQGTGDSRAALVAGKFLCLMKGSWEQGLPLLAKGADAASNAIAEREMAKPEDAAARVDLGDRWWGAAEAEAGPMKIRMQRRAAHWYGRALPKLEGLTRARVEKRLDEYANAAEEAGLLQRAVYLCDLKEEDYHVGFGDLGRNGQLGYGVGGNSALTKALLNGKELLHSLSLHPPTKGMAYITFKIDGEYRTLHGEVALADGDGRSAATPITFRVVGDGNVLWTSKPMTKPKSPEKLKVRLSGIQILRLEIDCPGDFVRAHAIWVEPQIIQ
jgi:hypothetical protein